MTGGSMRVDANVVVGPWPSDASASWTVDDVERHLDRFGLSAALVRSALAVTYDAALGNAALLADVEGHPRLLPSFVLGPLDCGEHGADPVAGAKAIWLLPARHGWSLTGPEAGSLQDVLRRAGLPVFIDLEETDWSAIDALCAALPSVDVVVAGIGYRTLRQAFPVMDRRPRLHVDLSYLAALDGLELFVSRYGASRVLLGTGAPVRDDAAPLFLLSHSGLSTADQAMVVGGTAARLLGLAADPVPDPVGESTLSVPALRVGTLPTGRGPNTAEPQADAVVDEQPDIVDAHVHLGRWPSSWLPHPDADTLLTAYDRTGTRHAVISHLSSIWGGDTPAGNAAALAAAEAHPDRLSVWLVANPNRPQDAALLAEQLQSPLVRGFKVHPDTHDCPIDDARLDWVWRLAVEASVPVLAHGFAGTVHSDPLLFGAVAARYPSLPLIVGHSGATVDGFRRTIAVAQEHPSILAETCGSWMTGRWLRRLVSELGADRVLHGTDACLIDPRYGVGRVLGAGLSAAAQALVLGGNARRVLGLSARSPSPLAGGH
ncbi:amidohydrolase family protein [Jiangella mangrovi]|uniref:Putative TIM-barrel fold metal-dependent hydrolase n=1 Tax=Jiangella mangrovi TaxID=1524084 RepID=A0A7W9GW80_9ACTN|nr:amidohydrolase family protein [Jiangella mangrovi]MBB5791192.1 putative TIM-barrel fold metal-dependent hydrolase [Jiangella mangrovi]